MAAGCVVFGTAAGTDDVTGATLTPTTPPEVLGDGGCVVFGTVLARKRSTISSTAISLVWSCGASNQIANAAGNDDRCSDRQIPA